MVGPQPSTDGSLEKGGITREPTMAQCFKCGQEMNATDWCTPSRLIRLPNGETVDPIRFGDEPWAFTYQEQVEKLERQIETGGRGELSKEQLQKQLDDFTTRWTADEYDSRQCHDCGVSIGEYHHPGCDGEACPLCDGQYLFCECETIEKRRIWNVVEE